MKIITEADFPIKQKTAVTLGAFDGVHMGHARLLSVMLETARKKDEIPLVWTLSDIPKLQAGQGIKYICTAAEKMKLLEANGARNVYTADFAALCDMSAGDFINEILIKQLNAGTVICGYNFRFGKNRVGDADFLAKTLAEQNIVCIVVPAVYTADGNEAISSTLIRRAVANGDMKTASALLGREYSFSFPVISGRQIGRTLGFPTVNQQFPDGFAVPSFGVYACRCEFGGDIYRAVSNIGVRPTFIESPTFNSADAPALCETYIFDFAGDLYNAEVRVFPKIKLRDEMKFDNADQLRLQIKADIENAMACDILI